MGNEVSGMRKALQLTTREKIIKFMGGVPSRELDEIKKEFNADRAVSWGTYLGGFSLPFDGEKNLGEIGPIKSYWMDFPRLRARSWQSYAESEITRTVIGRFNTWVIGSGLKLQAYPASKILDDENIKIDPKDFSANVERRFGLFLNSKKSNVNQMDTINTMASDSFKNAIVGGDVLIRMIFRDGAVRVQMIDGALVKSSVEVLGTFPNLLTNGNELRYGVEISPEGRVEAFHVCTRDLKYERIPARTAEGIECAFLVKGNSYRPSDVRGIPLVSVILETLAKLDRYKEAAVGSAEERAKVPYFIEHDQFSDGENPMLRGVAEAIRGGQVIDGNPDGRLPQTIEGEQLADKVVATTSKMTFNMPVGAKMNSLEAKNEMFFKEFYTTNIDIICASLGIPPDVAFSKYENSYSSSRAALKDWEHTLKVERNKFADQFYKKIYEFWLFCNVFSNKIDAPGYVKAVLTKDEVIVDSYHQCNFFGDNVPHIDPLKEVQAARLKLGPLGANLPLTTLEAATESLNEGDAATNVHQFHEELEEASEYGMAANQETETDAGMGKDKKKKKEVEED